ncbi:MAG TPA: type IV secretory system conjugative DNA transfer family protein, partial [Candidatus Paceibacterota bacterium]
GYTDRYTQEATPAIQNKIGQFTSNPLIRNIVGQSESSFDIREMMDQKKILIVNLSKGLVGDTNMQLLGSMLTTRIFLAAMSRADVPPSQMAKLPNFYFYVDEFQNFANETFAEILSEARKYKLNLVIAHQYIEQMDEQVRAAVFGNVGTTVAFRVGPFDAEVLETVFMPEFTKEDLVNLGFAQIYLTLMIDGVGSRPFSAITIPPIEAPARTFKPEVVAASRAQFGHTRAEIEAAIAAELSTPTPEPNGNGNGNGGNGSMQGAFRKPQAREAHEIRREKPSRENNVRGYQGTPREDMFARAKAPSPMPRRDAAPEKSPDDLKAMIRSMTHTIRTSQQQTQSVRQQSLKDTLAGVLKKGEQDAIVSKEEKTAAAEPPRQSATELPQPKPSAEKKPPFEVPEDQLRKILDGEA